jgi:hypothetical protein
MPSSAEQSSGWQLEKSKVPRRASASQGQSPPRGPVLGRPQLGGLLEPAGTTTEAGPNFKLQGLAAGGTSRRGPNCHAQAATVAWPSFTPRQAHSTFWPAASVRNWPELTRNLNAPQFGQVVSVWIDFQAKIWVPQQLRPSEKGAREPTVDSERCRSGTQLLEGRARVQELQVWK